MTSLIEKTNDQFAPNQVMNYLLKKHHVVPGYQSNSVIDVANDLLGLHSARLPTPFVSLAVRVNNFNSNMLWEPLYKDGDLIKLRCMRRTLHILSPLFSPIAHRATLSFRIADCNTKYKKIQIDDRKKEEIKSIIVELVKENPLSANDIQSLSKFKLGSLTNEYSQAISIAIKELWESGELCYINESPHWGKEQRLYGHAPTLYPKHRLNDLSIEEARRRLVFYHIDTFGPVTEVDIAWWSGLGRTVIREAIEHYAEKLVNVTIQSSDKTFYMTKSNYEHLCKIRDENDPWISLLAYEDPSLKGYYESRFLYVEMQHYNRLFNTIGEVRASIFSNGKAIGIWSIDKVKKRIDWEIFEETDRKTKYYIEKKISEMRNFLFEQS
ncbi:DNA glycosylase AlkZ-like family protein [Laceyella tengchongensis]